MCATGVPMYIWNLYRVRLLKVGELFRKEQYDPFDFSTPKIRIIDIKKSDKGIIFVQYEEIFPTRTYVQSESGMEFVKDFIKIPYRIKSVKVGDVFQYKDENPFKRKGTAVITDIRKNYRNKVYYQFSELSQTRVYEAEDFLDLYQKVKQ